MEPEHKEEPTIQGAVYVGRSKVKRSVIHPKTAYATLRFKVPKSEAVPSGHIYIYLVIGINQNAATFARTKATIYKLGGYLHPDLGWKGLEGTLNYALRGRKGTKVTLQQESVYTTPDGEMKPIWRVA